MEKLGKSMHQPSLKQTAGSVVSRKPAQSALRTAPLSSFPEKHRHHTSGKFIWKSQHIFYHNLQDRRAHTSVLSIVDYKSW